MHTGSLFPRNPWFFMAWLPKESNAPASVRKEWSCSRYLDPKPCPRHQTLIAAHDPLLSHLCHSRPPPAAGITSIIPFLHGQNASQQWHNPQLEPLVTWTHSFPMLTLANISSSSTTSYKLTHVICALRFKGWGKNCLGIALTLEQDPFLSVSKSSQQKSMF